MASVVVDVFSLTRDGVVVVAMVVDALLLLVGGGGGGYCLMCGIWEVVVVWMSWCVGCRSTCEVVEGQG